MKTYKQFMGEASGDRLYKYHQELRKKAGLPDPSYYTKLIKQYQDEKEKEAEKQRQQKQNEK